MKSVISLHASMTAPNLGLRLKQLSQRDRSSGLAKIGYHYVICRDGCVEKGRPEEEASMHDPPEFAKDRIAVCMVGGVDKDGRPENNFNAFQHQAFNLLYQAHNRALGRVPDLVVVCPSVTLEEVKSWIK